MTSNARKLIVEYDTDRYNLCVCVVGNHFVLTMYPDIGFAESFWLLVNLKDEYMLYEIGRKRNSFLHAKTVGACTHHPRVVYHPLVASAVTCGSSYILLHDWGQAQTRKWLLLWRSSGWYLWYLQSVYYRLSFGHYKCGNTEIGPRA